MFYIFKKSSPLQEYLDTLQNSGQSIGFVPTMGALHEGHLKLIDASLAQNDHTVCSIFVNPTQFNDPKDLKKYPRTPVKDTEKLINAGCDILFLPDTAEVYPPNLKVNLNIDFNSLDQILEGKFRPGHFAGVASVVHRLLQIVQPNQLFLGQKDYQQVQIIKKMIEQTGIKVKLSMQPIVRNTEGLALSSRNTRLSSRGKSLASQIYKSLQSVKNMIHTYSPREIEDKAIKMLPSPYFKVEYFKIVDPVNMHPINRIEPYNRVVVCTAVWVEQVRLIDNLIINT